MTLPNVVIAGAPKCGTTSLFEWLAAHPEVCGSSVKETNFLVDRDAAVFDPSSNIHDHGLSRYETYFEHCAGTAPKVVVEATPGYMYHRTPREVLARFDPPPQILFILRKPSARLYSTYQWARNNEGLVRGDMTFQDYVEAARHRGGPAEWKRTGVALLERCRYIDYLDEWLACFPRSNLHVFLFERMRADERAFMRHVAELLGLDASFYDTYDFPKMNRTLQLRSPRLHRARTGVRRLKPGRLLPDGWLKQSLQRVFRRSYARLNVQRVGYERSETDRAVLAALDREFAPYNERLARAFDLDLSPWEATRE